VFIEEDAATLSKMNLPETDHVGAPDRSRWDFHATTPTLYTDGRLCLLRCVLQGAESAHTISNSRQAKGCEQRRKDCGPCRGWEDTLMHSTTTWLELAALTRATADELSEPVDRRSILDIVTDYERWASYDVTGIEAGRWLGPIRTQRGW
jgi:hypothetical protein